MVPVTVPVHRLSVDDVYRMVEAGVLDEHDRVELVEGVLVGNNAVLKWPTIRAIPAVMEPLQEVR
jgi:hypothetical protein